MKYIYPPQIINGSLKRGNDTDYVRGKLYQLISVIRGELPAQPYYGLPFRCFDSLTDINVDAARLQAILKQEIPEAQFNVTASINNGQANINVNWSMLGYTYNEPFTISVNQ